MLIDSIHDETVDYQRVFGSCSSIIGDGVGCQQDILLEAPNTIIVESGDDAALTAALFRQNVETTTNA